MTSFKQMPALPDSVLAQVLHLRDMSLDELRALWCKLGGNSNFKTKRLFLERRLAYRLQELAFEKHDVEGLLQRNRARIDALIAQDETVEVPAKVDYSLPQAGTVLTRDYQGVRHQVLVHGDKHFEFEGKPYDNLSAIARDITGSRWSGPVFFNLRKRHQATSSTGR